MMLMRASRLVGKREYTYYSNGVEDVGAGRLYGA